jgi:hypothetical protein
MVENGLGILENVTKKKTGKKVKTCAVHCSIFFDDGLRKKSNFFM